MIDPFPSAFAGWLATGTAGATVLGLTAMLVLGRMRGRSAAERRLVLAVTVLALSGAAVSRGILPSWALGATPVPVPLDGVVVRADRSLEGQPVPREVLARFSPRSALGGLRERSWLMPAAGWLWLAGMFATLAIRVRAAAKVGRIVKSARRVPVEHALAMEVAVHARREKTAAPRVAISPAIAGPFTCGLGRFAWLVVPVDFAHEADADRAAMLRHELAHLRQGDSLLQAVVALWACVLWFHPLVHWLEWRLRLEAEKACDDAVLRPGMAPRDYAELLLTRYQRTPLAPGLAVTGPARPARRSREMLRERIRSLANGSLARTTPGRALRWIATGMALMCGVAAGAVRLRQEADWLFHVVERPEPAGGRLVARWTLDGGDEPSMRPVSAVPSPAGQVAGAFVFDGAESYVDLDPALVANLTFPFTFCGWVRSSETESVQTMLFAGSGRPTSYLQLGIAKGQAALICRDGGTPEWMAGGRLAADGQWHHIAGVFYSTGRRELFVDGEQVAFEEVYRRRPAITRLQIARNGRDRIGDFLCGMVDDVRIYAGALTSADLRGIMQGGHRLMAVPVARAAGTARGPRR